MTEARREAYEERAAILEFDAGLTREEAEREAREQIYRKSAADSSAQIEGRK